MSLAAQFNEHIRTLCAQYEQALDACGYDGVLIHSGSEMHYYADDRGVPFKTWGHFLHWLPVDRPDQLLLFRPGNRPTYFQVVPPDFWYEQSIPTEPWWTGSFDVQMLEQAEDAAPRIAGRHRIAFLGENTAFAAALGIDDQLHNPAALLHWLDYERARKTPYEIAQIAEANRLALLGHKAARLAFEEGGSEYQIHQAYLLACNIIEEETPYTNIVALNEKSAILHYQNKRRQAPSTARTRSQVLLIDAGCRVHNYCSDITRTHTRPEAHPVFHALLAGMDVLQQTLVGQVRPGESFLELHIAAHAGVCELLLRHGVCAGSVAQLMEEGISTLFFPHGLGHLLGIQVHDVGGRQQNRAGDILPPPPRYPALRTTRQMEEGQVFTIEPGLYFIPSLLDPERSSSRGRLIDWSLVDELLPCGGIRIEDNILVTSSGHRNLTRG